MSPPSDPSRPRLPGAAHYLLHGLDLLDIGQLGNPTPCTGWDLRTLLHHLADSIDALTDILVTGQLSIELPAEKRVQPEDVVLVESVRSRTVGLVESWRSAPAGTYAIGDRALHCVDLERVAMIELAVHGWDVAQATMTGLPLPAPLARELLPVARNVVPPTGRGPEFRDPVLPHGRGRAPSDDLLGYLGRQPWLLPSPRTSPPRKPSART